MSMTNKEWLQSLDTEDLIDELFEEPWFNIKKLVKPFERITWDELVRRWLNAEHEDRK